MLEGAERSPEPGDAAVVPVVSGMSERPLAVESSPGRRINWRGLVCLSWAVGVLVMLARLALSLIAAGRLVRRSSALEDAEVLRDVRAISEETGLRRKVEILVSERLRAPATMGLWKPKIILPKRLLHEFKQEQIRELLMHELAHVARRDYAVNLLQRVVEAVYFFHPLVWVLSRKARTHRELACDEYVLQKSHDRRSYAATLTKLAESVNGVSGAAEAAMVCFVPVVVRRVKHALSGKLATRRRARAMIGIVAAILIGLLGASGTRAVMEAREPASGAGMETAEAMGVGTSSFGAEGDAAGLEAEEMTVEADCRYTILAEVDAWISVVPSHARGRQPTITADKLAISPGRKTVKYTGDVRMTWGETSLVADGLTFWSDEGIIEVTGKKVTVEKPGTVLCLRIVRVGPAVGPGAVGAVAVCDEADYDAATNRLYLRGGESTGGKVFFRYPKPPTQGEPQTGHIEARQGVVKRDGSEVTFTGVLKCEGLSGVFIDADDVLIRHAERSAAQAAAKEGIGLISLRGAEEVTCTGGVKVIQDGKVAIAYELHYTGGDSAARLWTVGPGRRVFLRDEKNGKQLEARSIAFQLKKEELEFIEPNTIPFSEDRESFFRLYELQAKPQPVTEGLGEFAPAMEGEPAETGTETPGRR
jgi:beta-lactamase regulating signal transducer with metallopeptidase domain